MEVALSPITQKRDISPPKMQEEWCSFFLLPFWVDEETHSDFFSRFELNNTKSENC